MKKINLSIALIFMTLSLFAQELPKDLEKAYNTYSNSFPITKVYLHTDRTLYKTNETLWFTAYIVDAQNRPTAENEVLFAELIDPKGNIIKRWNIKKYANQCFRGDFVVGQNNIGGIYKIRAYTNWMRNWGEDFYFEKEITVQNVITPRLLMKLDFEKEAYSSGQEVVAELDVREPNDEPLSDYSFNYTVTLAGKSYLMRTEKTNEEGKTNIRFRLPNDLNTSDGLLNVMIDFEGSTESISRSVPIVLNNVIVDFFPEGGYIMNNIKNNIAFKALNEFGKPADIKGILKNSQGKTLTTFESYHQGLGGFELTADANETYTVELTQPSNQTFILPKALNTGIGIRKVNQEADEVSFHIHTSQPQTIHLVGELAGKVYYSKTITNAKSGLHLIKTDTLPIGIMKLTVFDAQLHPQAERLVFINPHRKAHINAKFGKAKYAPGERIGLSFTVTDETGKGVSGNFSLAVVDDQWHTFADDKQDNILSYLLMSSELQGDVFEPDFYFKKTTKGATQLKALDYVMMTHGWRRFNWREIIEEQNNAWASKIKYPKDRVYLKGTVSMNGKPQKGAKVFFADDKSNAVKTNKEGVFEMPISIEKNSTQYRKVIAKYRGFEAIMNVNSNSFNHELPSFNQSTTPTASIKDIKNQLEIKVKEISKPDIPIAVINNRSDVARALSGQVSGVVQVTRAKMSATSIQAMDMVNLSTVSESIVVGYGTYTYSGDGLMDGYGIDVNMNPRTAPQLSMSPLVNNRNQFYYGKNFAQQRYYPNQRRNAQTKAPSTILWVPSIKTNNQGYGGYNFYANGKNTTYRAIIEGVSDEGKIGRGEATCSIESPFNVEVKIPEVVTTGDQFLVSVLLKNNTDKQQNIYIFQDNNVKSNRNTAYLKLPPATQKAIPVKANSFIREEFLLDAGNAEMLRYLIFNVRANNTFADYQQHTIKVVSKGFDRHFSFSDNTISKKVSFELDEYEENSLKANFNLYPNITSELEDGVKGMLREPHGCFEQVSSSNYPNVYAMIYMKEMDVDDKEAKATAKKYMSRAYTKLAGYECIDGGFDWYGQSPADERLTAYGLLEFMDMKKVYSRVNQNMIDRTAAWLVSRLNDDGSWKGGYYGYRQHSAVHNAYITHAMSVYGKIDIDKSIERITQEAENSKDWYRLSLATMSNWNVGNNKKAAELLDLLVSEVNQKGILKPTIGKTVTYSYGHSANVETWSLIAQAIIQQNRGAHNLLLMELIQRIATSKTRTGYFGSTQATVQALKALVEYSKISEQALATGEVQLFVNNQKVYRKHFTASDKRAINFDLRRFLKKGTNTFEVKFLNTNKSIPYTLGVGWKTLSPSSSPDCRFDFNTAIAKNEVQSGETVRLTATLKNPSKDDLFNPIALVGIPSGLSLQPWQLKELQERKAFDYYEVQGNYLVLYFRHLKSEETKNVHLDLKADIVGNYKGGASSAYLYYGSEHKRWESGLDVVVKK